MRSTLRSGIVAIALAASLSSVFHSSIAGLSNASSRRLADSVAGGSMSAAGSCAGTIDMTKAAGSSSTISVAELNALIVDNGGSLVLVVDVNEANGGLETSLAQGLGVKRAEVLVNGVTIGGGTANPGAGFYPFSTQTQAQIAEAGTTTRRTWYTLLGDSGSNEITTRNIDGKVYDSTLRIPINGAIPAGATDIKLRVEFLKTNTNLGDPEDFYDCTGGAEDVAIVTQGVATYYDVTVPTTTVFRAESVAVQLSPEGQQTAAQSGTAAASSSWVLMPGASTFKMVLYEDLYPNAGDYDFNDAVVGYRYGLRVDANGMVDQIKGEAYLIARGSNYAHEWNLTIPVAGQLSGTATCTTVMGDSASVPPGRECRIAADSGSIRWHAFDGTRIVLPPTDPARPQQNTFAGVAVKPGPRATFTVTLATPLPLSSFGTDDPWLYVVDTQQEIHLSTRAPGSNLPFALLVPSTLRVVTEGTDFVAAYPQFATFVASGGTQAGNWDASPAAGKVVDWRLADWAWVNAF